MHFDKCIELYNHHHNQATEQFPHNPQQIPLYLPFVVNPSNSPQTGNH